MKLIFQAIVKKTGKVISSDDIARFNFNDGELYGILTWDEATYFLEELDIIEISFYKE